MPPPIAPVPPPFFLRPVAAPDEGFLLRLYANIRAEELARTGWDASQRDAFIRQQFHARRSDYATRFPGAEESIVVIQGKDAGAWTVWRGKNEIRLVNVELDSANRGRGVGGALISGLLQEAKTSRLPAVLSVREDNLAAQRLYLRLGFVRQSRAHGYLGMRAFSGKR